VLNNIKIENLEGGMRVELPNLRVFPGLQYELTGMLLKLLHCTATPPFFTFMIRLERPFQSVCELGVRSTGSMQSSERPALSCRKVLCNNRFFYKTDRSQLWMSYIEVVFSNS